VAKVAQLAGYLDAFDLEQDARSALWRQRLGVAAVLGTLASPADARSALSEALA
jgi:hypothetical protein